jgi:hypothetical protein
LSRAIRHLRVGGQIAHNCGGAMGIGMYKDWVFEISTPGRLGRVKLRADRNSGGAVKWLESLPSADLH